MIKKKDLSQDNKKAWEEFTKDPSGIYDKDKSDFKIPDVRLRFKFDLHGLSLDEANYKVKEIILSCIEKNFREILLITGKGNHSTNYKDVYKSKDLGKLRFSVPEFLNSDKEINKLILSVDSADPKDGGDGAILIKLRNLQNKF